MIEILTDGSNLLVHTSIGDLRPRDESQLAYWGFTYDSASERFIHPDADLQYILPKIVSYFTRSNLSFCLSNGLNEIIRRIEHAQHSLHEARQLCDRMKQGTIDGTISKQFGDYLSTSVRRALKTHQFKAAIHLLSAQNGANFSVPGSGKTSVVLSVFGYLRKLGVVDALFVIGPPACFGPWRAEYAQVFGKNADFEMFSGGDIEDRRTRYLVDSDSVADLYLTTYQTLERDSEYVCRLFSQRGIRFFLTIDEAHYIKQIDGRWANAVLKLAAHATRRCILTGTPFPRCYADAFNLFDVLWPNHSPIYGECKARIERHSQRSEHDKAAHLLEEAIGPLYYRVRKQDLGLAPQEFHPSLRIRMNKHERYVYDSIIDRIRYASHSDFYRDLEVLARLRRARMIRLRQCVSYASLLKSSVPDDDVLDDANPSLASIIRDYDSFEEPAKLTTLLELASEFQRTGEKMVVWSTFIGTLHLIEHRLLRSGHKVRLIYGGTPVETRDITEELGREDIIAEFVNPGSDTNVLVANPAACAESISLHKACSHAVYYDCSYNCAQYLQSLDRIHRVGGSENKAAHYYFLEYEDSIDGDILRNVRAKADRMLSIIEKEYPIYSLDMFADDEDNDLQAYERLFIRHEL